MLYVLSRVLLDAESEKRVYYPEGGEDLHIRDLLGKLIETVQVKDYTSPLTFSIFEPKNTNCYFYRVRDRLKKEPQARNVLASFGEIGEELAAVLGKSNASETASFQKLAEYSTEAKKQANRGTEFPTLTTSEAMRVLGCISVEEVQEEKINQDLRTALSPSMMGAAPSTAMELLLFWIFEASEKAEAISRASVLRKANQIGRALAAMQSHHQEWGRSIVTLEARSLSEEERSLLKDSFEQGVQATWQHILAGIDVARPGKMDEIREKLERSNVVIIHGASGQGKTTLAFRYLFNSCPDGWRFQVRAVTGRDHALNIALALNSHAEAMGIPAHILLDVGPNDHGWTEMAIRLAENPKLKILVVVREEDYRRAHFDPSSVLVEQVNLDSVNESEAQTIFASLTDLQPTKHFLNFQDAWSQFGGGGPLMEFTFLVTQGEALRDKLTSQLERLEAEASRANPDISANHLSLLTLVSIAAAFECRLTTAKACQVVGLPIIPNPLRHFEKEYLVREFNRCGQVGGLHGVRSTIIRDHLLRATPEIWADYAVNCLSLLIPSDLEGFLLRSFSRYPEHTDKILHGLLALSEVSWAAIGGIARALLWLGISRYEESNRQTLHDLQATCGAGWMFFVDGFIAETGDETFRSIQQVAVNQEPVAQLLAERVRHTPKEAAFAPFKVWIEQMKIAPEPPSSEEDWCGLADVAFWIGHLNLDVTLRKALETIPYNSALESLEIETLADVVLGVSRIGSAAFGLWRSNHEAVLRERFLHETESLEIEISPQRAFVKFLVEDEPSQSVAPNSGEAVGWHDQTMQRLNILRGLFPDVEVYASQGLGFDLLPFAIPHDPTKKEITKKNLPTRKTVSLNATFHGLVKLRHARPPDWEVYRAAVLKARTCVMDVLEKLRRGIDSILSRHARTDLWDHFVTTAEWNKAASQLTLPNLPKCAVDEWGFASEGRSEGTSTTGAFGESRAIVLIGYRRFLKSARDYTFSLGLFFEQFKKASLSCLALRGTAGIEGGRRKLFEELPNWNDLEKHKRLCLLNLSEALEKLPEFQMRYRDVFGVPADTALLDELKVREERTLQKIFGLCREFIISPTLELQGATVFAENVDRNNRQRFLTMLKVELSKLKSAEITARLVTETGAWEGNGALWIGASIDDLQKMNLLSGAVAEAFRAAVGACRFGEWDTNPLQREWPRIVIAPQLRGRSLNKCGCSIPSRTLFAQNGISTFSPVFEVALPVRSNEWPNTLQVWTDLTVVLCVRWLDAVITFLKCFETLGYLFSAAEAAGSSRWALQCQGEKHAKAISSAINLAVDSYDAFRDHLRTCVGAQALGRVEVREVLAQLEEWGAKVFPHTQTGIESVELSFSEYFEWRQSLDGPLEDTTRIAGEVLDGFLPIATRG